MSEEAASQMPHLVVSLEGDGIRSGRIPAADLVQLVDKVQQCVRRIGLALSEGAPNDDPSALRKAVEAACTLEVLMMRSAGGFEIAFDLALTQARELDPPDGAGTLGQRAIAVMVQGIALLGQQDPWLHDAFDYGVLVALRDLTRLLDRGADRIRLRSTCEGIADREGALNAGVRDRIHDCAQGASKQGLKVKGWVLEVDLEGQRCRIRPPEGPQVICVYDERNEPIFAEALNRYVVATGAATERSPDGRILKLEVHDIEIVDEELSAPDLIPPARSL